MFPNNSRLFTQGWKKENCMKAGNFCMGAEQKCIAWQFLHFLIRHLFNNYMLRNMHTMPTLEFLNYQKSQTIPFDPNCEIKILSILSVCFIVIKLNWYAYYKTMTACCYKNIILVNQV